jgi:hypothetical protein
MVPFGHEDMAEFFSVRNGKLGILKMRLFSDKDSKARRALAGKNWTGT